MGRKTRPFPERLSRSIIYTQSSTKCHIKMFSSIKSKILEEHTLLQSYGHPFPFHNLIWDVFPGRYADAKDHSIQWLADMNASGISQQIISHIPGIFTSDPIRYRAETMSY